MTSIINVLSHTEDMAIMDNGKWLLLCLDFFDHNVAAHVIIK